MGRRKDSGHNHRIPLPVTSSRRFPFGLAALTFLAGPLLALACRPSSPPADQVTPPAGMVYVPGGKFLTGSTDYASDPDVGALREVYVGPFFIDRTEISNAEVKRVWPEFTLIPGSEDKPAVELSWNEAVDVLSRMGKRLPTSLEWEKAGRGTDGRKFPWGDSSDFKGRAHVGTPADHKSKDHKCGWGELVAVTENPAGASPYGALNMVGNVFEWVGDPPTSQRPYHLIRGGAFGYPAHHNRLDTVTYEQPGAT